MIHCINWSSLTEFHTVGKSVDVKLNHLCRAGFDSLRRTVVNVDLSRPAVVVRSANRNICLSEKKNIEIKNQVYWTGISMRQKLQSGRWTCLRTSPGWHHQCSPPPSQTWSLWCRLDGWEWFPPTFLPGCCKHKLPLPRLRPSCRTGGPRQLCPAIWIKGRRKHVGVTN